MLVSVIVPVYNAEKYINNTIESILDQTYKNIELLIIDDGSTDSSAKICDEWGKKDNRVKCIHRKNKGVSAARNYGLEIAEGDYIVFCDSDDWLDEEYIHELVMNVQKSKVVISSFQQMTEKGINTRNYNFKKDNERFNKNKFFEDCINGYIYTFTVWGKIFARDIIGDTRFVSLPYSEDAIFVRTVLTKCESVKFIDSEGYHYRINQNSVTVDSSRIEEKVAGSLALSCHTLNICRKCNMLGMSEKFEKILMNSMISYLKTAIKNPIRYPEKSRKILDSAMDSVAKKDFKYKKKIYFLRILYKFKLNFCPKLKIK